MLMDNCCGCGAGPGYIHAAVEARVTWPGWPALTVDTPSLDFTGKRYLTYTVTMPNDTPTGLVTKSITADPYNGTVTDLLTGTDAEAEGYSVGGFGPLPPWPPPILRDDYANWEDTWIIQLSNPITIIQIQHICQGLLDSIDLNSLTMGVDSKYVTYDPSSQPPANNGFWQNRLAFCALPSAPGPDTLLHLKYAWMDAMSGSPLTATPDHDPVPGVDYWWNFSPWVHLPPTVQVYDHGISGTDDPPSAMSRQWYENTMLYGMRKSISSPVSAAVCCETGYLGYDITGLPPNTCAMRMPSGGKLVLDRPNLAIDVRDGTREIYILPWFDKALTAGGCPCA